jgi:hypothetical protein
MAYKRGTALTRRDYVTIMQVFGFTDVDEFIGFVNEQHQHATAHACHQLDQAQLGHFASGGRL